MVISSQKKNYTPSENRNELNLEQKFGHNIIAICELVLPSALIIREPNLPICFAFFCFFFSVCFSRNAKNHEKCFIQLPSSPPEDNKTSQPLSRTRISTSQEDISRDDMLGDGDFRRVKSERRMKSYFRRNYKLPGKEEEKFERQRSLRLRQSIRAKYGLPNPSRKNPLLTDS